MPHRRLGIKAQPPCAKPLDFSTAPTLLALTLFDGWRCAATPLPTTRNCVNGS